MLARFVRARSVTILAGLVLLFFNRHSPKLCSYDCVDSCILHRIVYSFSNGWRQEEFVLLEEGNEQIMHCIVPIDGRDDITGGHLLCKGEERTNNRVQLLGKAWWELLLKLDQ